MANEDRAFTVLQDVSRGIVNIGTGLVGGLGQLGRGFVQMFTTGSTSVVSLFTDGEFLDPSEAWAAVQAVAYTLTGEVDTSDRGLKRLFDHIDQDGSGAISREELQRALEKAYGVNVQKLPDHVMPVMDVDKNGSISLEEFMKTIRAAEKLRLEDALMLRKSDGGCSMM